MRLANIFANKLLSPYNLLFYLLLSYFAYHLFFSAKGIISYYDLKKQSAAKNFEYTELIQKKKHLQIHVDLMNPDNSAQDMMEEKIKDQFSFVEDGELLIVNDLKDEELEDR